MVGMIVLIIHSKFLGICEIDTKFNDVSPRSSRKRKIAYGLILFFISPPQKIYVSGSSNTGWPSKGNDLIAQLEGFVFYVEVATLIDFFVEMQKRKTNSERAETANADFIFICYLLVCLSFPLNLHPLFIAPSTISFSFFSQFEK